MSAPLPVWSDEELREDLRKAVADFVARRLAEPAEAHPRHLKAARGALADLLRAMAGFGPDPLQPNLTALRRVLVDARSAAALRYVTAPPISEDDLHTLTAVRPERLTKTELGRDDALARRLFHLILAMHDHGRFPWFPKVTLDAAGTPRLVAAARTPRPFELRRALAATAPLQAAQSLATERRGFGRAVEGALRDALRGAGFVQDKPADRDRVDNAKAVPEAGRFFGECSFFGRRADLLIGLPDAFVVAVESKDSSSTVNSVKRLANDTGAKARTWRDGYGANVTTVALISGVYALDNLKQAQIAGVRLVWAHRIDEFVEWLVARAGSAVSGANLPDGSSTEAREADRQLNLL